MLPIASHHFSAYLASPDWRKHHAALVALAQISPGCSKALNRDSQQVVTMVLNSFHHPHPRVRWAAITAIARLSIELYSHFQLQYYTRVLPALASAMGDPRLQAHAASALINFNKNCTPDMLTPYLDEIVSALCLLLQSGNNKFWVQEAALTALASVADNSTQEQFQKYYDQVMPYLKAILLVSKDEKASCMLRVKAKRCIGHFVGKDKFRDDPKPVNSSFYDANSVYHELLVVLGYYWNGLSVSDLPLSYSTHFDRSLDYKSLGVTSIEELLVKMGDRVHWREHRESKVKYVMSASVVEVRRRLYLKPDVQTLLNSHHGEIKFGIFEDVYWDQFKRIFHYGFYGLTDLDHLCEALKDILEVELDRSGEKVIKAVKRYNLRKRKRQLSEPGPRPKKIAPSKCK
ncbi:hypothetical protein CTI12_AA037920 [Artemisia annua]|uniref:HTH OST-type domain-containing protein n=1 Tax=Artemisia annua TaxID=35608 RepID=A0A2U1QES6_ARTAN|nr:hypothetical protein CTI12_AA037920 [Artemisia annua]